MLVLKLLQGSLLRDAMASIEKMAINATMAFSPVGLSLQAWDTTRLVFGILRFRSSGFDHFHCDETSFVGLKLNRLHRILSFATDEDAITIHCGDGNNTMAFVFDNYRTSQSRFLGMTLQVKGQHLNIYESDYDFLFGIPSKKFRPIFGCLSNRGGVVDIDVTDEQLKFSVGSTRFILTNEQCTIRGVAIGRRLKTTLGLHHTKLFMRASLLSDRVWIHDSRHLPTLLNFPVGVLGNIIFYFAYR